MNSSTIAPANITRSRSRIPGPSKVETSLHLRGIRQVPKLPNGEKEAYPQSSLTALQAPITTPVTLKFLQSTPLPSKTAATMMRAVPSVENPQREELLAIARINETCGALEATLSSFVYRKLRTALLSVSYTIVTPESRITKPIETVLENEGYRVGTCTIDEDGVLIIPCVPNSPKTRKRQSLGSNGIGRPTGSSSTVFSSPLTAYPNGPITAPSGSSDGLATVTPPSKYSGTGGDRLGKGPARVGSPAKPDIRVCAVKLDGSPLESPGVLVVAGEIKGIIDGMKYISFCRVRTELTKKRHSIIRPNISATTEIEEVFNKHNYIFVSCVLENGMLNFTCTSNPRKPSPSAPVSERPEPEAETGGVSPTGLGLDSRAIKAPAPLRAFLKGSAGRGVASGTKTSGGEPRARVLSGGKTMLPSGGENAAPGIDGTRVSSKITTRSKLELGRYNPSTSHANYSKDKVVSLPAGMSSGNQLPKRLVRITTGTSRTSIPRPSAPSSTNSTSAIRPHNKPKTATKIPTAAKAALPHVSNVGKKVAKAAYTPANSGYRKFLPEKGIVKPKVEATMKPPAHPKKQEALRRQVVKEPKGPKKGISTKAIQGIKGGKKAVPEGSLMVKWITKIGGESWIKSELARGGLAATKTRFLGVRRESAPGRCYGARRDSAVSSAASKPKYQRRVTWG